MANSRMINTRFWNDGFVSQLDPLEKLLFIYFLTNEHVNIGGIYELPLKIIAVETGIDTSMLEKMLPRLEPKILYREGWVVIPRFPKYQNLKSADVVKGIIREFDCVPKNIQTLAKDRGWGDGLGMVSDHLGMVSDTILNLTKPTERENSTEFPSSRSHAVTNTTTGSNKRHNQEGDVTFEEYLEQYEETEVYNQSSEMMVAAWKSPGRKTPYTLEEMEKRYRSRVKGQSPRGEAYKRLQGVNKVLICFSDACYRELGKRPVFGAKERGIVDTALKKIPEDKILDLCAEWFTLNKPDEETIQITRALSTNQINGYIARNQ